MFLLFETLIGYRFLNQPQWKNSFLCSFAANVPILTCYIFLIFIIHWTPIFWFKLKSIYKGFSILVCSLRVILSNEFSKKWLKIMEKKIPMEIDFFCSFTFCIVKIEQRFQFTLFWFEISNNMHTYHYLYTSLL